MVISGHWPFQVDIRNEELLTVQIEEQEKLNRDQIREAESNSIILKELRYEILQLKSKLSVN